MPTLAANRASTCTRLIAGGTLVDGPISARCELDAAGRPVEDSRFLAPALVAEKCAGRGLCRTRCPGIHGAEKNPLDARRNNVPRGRLQARPSAHRQLPAAMPGGTTRNSVHAEIKRAVHPFLIQQLDPAPSEASLVRLGLGQPPCLRQPCTAIQGAAAAGRDPSMDATLPATSLRERSPGTLVNCSRRARWVRQVRRPRQARPARRPRLGLVPPAARRRSLPALPWAAPPPASVGPCRCDR